MSAIVDPATDAALDDAVQVADAALYEGYVRFPDRAPAARKQLRWQFGVLAPRAYALAAAERWYCRTECLVEPRGATEVSVRTRFLQLRRRSLEQATPAGFRPVDQLTVGADRLVPWDEAVPAEFRVLVPLGDLLAEERALPIEVAGGRVEEVVVGGGGRVVRERWPLHGRLRLSATQLPGASALVRLRVVVENAMATGRAGPVPRDEVLRRSLIAAHCILVLTDGTFLSLIDPPEWAAAAAGECVNEGTWPALVGPPDRPQVVISSPIILDDFPADRTGER
jgi:hypothetical protein